MAQEQQQDIEPYSVKDVPVVLGGSDGANSSLKMGVPNVGTLIICSSRLSCK
jgi:hypothetical protein